MKNFFASFFAVIMMVGLAVSFLYKSPTNVEAQRKASLHKRLVEMPARSILVLTGHRYFLAERMADDRPSIEPLDVVKMPGLPWERVGLDEKEIINVISPEEYVYKSAAADFLAQH